MSIQQMLGDIPATEFVAQFFNRLPFSKPQGAKHLCELNQWNTLLAILARPGADVMICRRNERFDGECPTTRDGAESLISEGWTILVRHAERHDRQLAELADSFAGDFAAPVNIHIYATPAQQYGFGWHYDAEDVFIVQTTGRKEYLLRKNTVNPWPLEETLPLDMRYEREIMPLMRCMLAAGDWLYIPAGYWHMGQANETALSLAIGVMTHTAIEVVDRLRRQLLDSILWRQRLPVGGAAGPGAAAVREQLRAVLAELAKDCNRLMTSEQFLSEVMSLLHGE